MNTKYSELYQNWYNHNFLSSIRNYENDQDWKTLLEWCRKHKKEAVLSILEQIKDEPNDTVYILDDLFDHPLKTDGFVPLKEYCDVWIGLLREYGKN